MPKQLLPRGKNFDLFSGSSSKTCTAVQQLHLIVPIRKVLLAFMINDFDKYAAHLVQVKMGWWSLFYEQSNKKIS